MVPRTSRTPNPEVAGEPGNSYDCRKHPRNISCRLSSNGRMRSKFFELAQPIDIRSMLENDGRAPTFVMICDLDSITGVHDFRRAPVSVRQSKTRERHPPLLEGISRSDSRSQGPTHSHGRPLIRKDVKSCATDRLT